MITLEETGSLPALHSTRRGLRPMAAFVGSALAFVAVAFSVGAPSPLFVLYQHEWGFADAMLTVAFAIYAVTLLVTLLIAGSLSDHIGRRPVLIAALALEAAAMLLFLFAQDIGWIVVARAVQGVGTGAAMATFSASLVELAPERHKKLGAVIGSTAPIGGIALGAIVTGVVVQFAAQPTVWIFSALVLVFAAGLLVVVGSHETVERRPGAVRSLIPRLMIPQAARREFVGALPLLAAAWMLSGLFIGLAPSIVRGVFHLESGLVNGAVVGLAPATGAAAGLLLSRYPARLSTIGGTVAILVGVGLTVVSVTGDALWLLFAASAVGGVGFGAAFSAVMRILAPLAPAEQRAELFAGVYLVNYLAYGLPALVAGELIAVVGLVPTVAWYAGVIGVVAIVAIVAQLMLTRPRPLTAGR
ncbi:MFS transporter [Leifsonia poae]|uniref:MFS transporter n=1 Tax=Leifsonia poae TaxID=110933 RepID=UPI001CBAE27E|nr:MFS transporter [Leifsonia poae]